MAAPVYIQSISTALAEAARALSPLLQPASNQSQINQPGTVCGSSGPPLQYRKDRDMTFYWTFIVITHTHTQTVKMTKP